MRNKKRAQMEIMGLAMVVILISLGLLFLVKFNLSSKPSEIHKSYTKTELSSSFLNTMLSTTSESCYGLSFKQLYQECAKGSTLKCDSLDVCYYTELNTNKLLNSTFVQWGLNYSFSVFINEQSPLFSIRNYGGCTGDKRSRTQPLPLGTSTLLLKMDVC